MNRENSFFSDRLSKILKFFSVFLFVFGAATLLNINHSHAFAASCPAPYPGDNCGYFYNQYTTDAGDPVFSCGLRVGTDSSGAYVNNLQDFITDMRDWVNGSNIPTADCDGNDTPNAEQYEAGAAYIILQLDGLTSEAKLDNAMAAAGIDDPIAFAQQVASDNATSCYSSSNPAIGTYLEQYPDPCDQWETLMYYFQTGTDPEGDAFSVIYDYAIPASGSVEQNFCEYNTLYQIPSGFPGGNDPSITKGDVAYFDGEPNNCNLVENETAIEFYAYNTDKNSTLVDFFVKDDCGNPIGQVTSNALPVAAAPSGGLSKVSCTNNPPEVTGYAYNTMVDPNDPIGETTNGPLSINVEVYVNGKDVGTYMVSQTVDPASGPLAGDSGPYGFTLSSAAGATAPLPAALSALVGTDGSATVQIYAQWYDSYGLTVPQNGWVQIGSTATFSCTAPSNPQGSITASCIASPPYVEGYVYNLAVPATNVTFYLGVGANHTAGGPYTANGGVADPPADTTGTHGFQITNDLPAALITDEASGGSTSVQLYAYEYIGSTVTATLVAVGSPATFNCGNTAPTGSITASCTAKPPYVEGYVYNEDSPATNVTFYLGVSGNDTAGGPYTANGDQPDPPGDTTGTHGFEITNDLPTQLTSKEPNGGSITVTLYAYDYIAGHVTATLVAAGSATFTCPPPITASTGSITASCESSPPYVEGYIYNADVPATSITFYFGVGGDDTAGGPYTSNDAALNPGADNDGTHGFKITGDLPTQLTSLEAGGGSATVQLYAYSYENGATTGSLVAVGSPATFDCAPPVATEGDLFVSCDPPIIDGYAFNSSTPGTSIDVYFNVNGGADIGPFTTDQYLPALNLDDGLTGNHGFTIPQSSYPPTLTNLETNGGTAVIRLFAYNYQNGQPLATLVQVGGPDNFTCTKAPGPTTGPEAITGSCNLIESTKAVPGGEYPPSFSPAPQVSFNWEWAPASGPSAGTTVVAPVSSLPGTAAPTVSGTGVWEPTGSPTRHLDGTIVESGGSAGPTWADPDPGAAAPAPPPNTEYDQYVLISSSTSHTTVTLHNPNPKGKPATKTGESTTITNTYDHYQIWYPSFTYYVDPPNTEKFSVITMQGNITDNWSGYDSGLPTCDGNAPTITGAISQSCATGNVSFDPSDKDYAPLPAGTVAYQIDGGPIITTNVGTINLSNYDQLQNHTIIITVNDVNVLGQVATLNEGQAQYLAVWSYTPCYTAHCGTADVPSTLEPSRIGGTSDTFNATVTLQLTPIGGAPATPTKMGGTLTSYFNGGTGTPPDSLGSPTLTNTFNIPSAAGDYNFTWTFTDGPNPPIDLNCGPIVIIIANKPVLRTYGGDVTAGNGFINSLASCTETPGSEIETWNDDIAKGYAGSGSQFAVTAVGDIDGFVSADGAATGIPTGLSFGNQTNLGGDDYGGNFSGSLPCIPDYKDAQVSTAASDYECPGAATIQNQDLYGCDLNGVAGVYFLGGITQPTVIRAAGNVVIDCGAGATLPTKCNGPTFDTNLAWGNAATGSLDVPSLFLVTTGNIFIDGTVSTLDGVYISQNNTGTGGTIYTCATSVGTPNPASSTYFNLCNNQLVVNGAMVAYQFELGRTWGTAVNSTSGDTAAAPGPGWQNAAEIVNYTPQVWLGNPFTIQQNSYESITSLPPVL